MQNYRPLAVETIVRWLHAFGVTHWVISPGSRSGPIAMAVCRLNLPMTVHIDERGAGFFALGIAQISGPVAVITTSGSAVANLFPAIVEAQHSHIPLWILSADRPPDLIDTGHNQTMDQIKIFGSMVTDFVGLPTSDQSVTHSSIHARLTRACTRGETGPIHINFPISNPKDLPLDPACPAISLPNPPYPYAASPAIHPTTLTDQLAPYLKLANGVLIVGRIPQSARPLIQDWLNQWNWPFIADISSGLRHWNHPKNLRIGEGTIQPGVVVAIGDRWIPTERIKIQRSWQCPWISITGNSIIMDYPGNPTISIPGHWRTVFPLLKTLPVTASTLGTTTSTCKFSPPSNKDVKKWIHLPESIEISAAQKLGERLINSDLFLGNSLGIRLWDLLIGTTPTPGPIYTHRGVSGIDGNIATIAGIARGTHRPINGIIGDLAALHDLNSLAMIRQSPIPIRLWIVNNTGGGIFSTLLDSSIPHFDTIFYTPHTHNFYYISKQFGLPYTRIHTIADLDQYLNIAPHYPIISEVIEIAAPPPNRALIQELVAAIY